MYNAHIWRLLFSFIYLFTKMQQELQFEILSSQNLIWKNTRKFESSS